MLGIKFNTLPKHRKFNYKPVYYNEDKERLDAQVHAIKRELGEEQSDANQTKANIRAAFKPDSDRRSDQPLKRFYSLRVLAIAGMIGFIIVKVSKTDLLERLLESVMK